MRSAKTSGTVPHAGRNIDRNAVLTGAVIAAATLLFLVFAMPSAGQGRRDVLTDQQTEDLREHADQPNEKLKLYVGYIEQRISQIHQVTQDPNSPRRSANLHSLYQEFTAISDELEDNMDSYGDQHEDERKALKTIAEESEKWSPVLKEPEDRPEYDFVREASLDACQSLHDDSEQLLNEQEKYFAAQKKEGKSAGGGRP